MSGQRTLLSSRLSTSYLFLETVSLNIISLQTIVSRDELTSETEELSLDEVY